jgi:UDP-N-acetylmuramyl-tripeptide synthetase
VELRDLLVGVEIVARRGDDVSITEVRDDSRAVGPGDLFVALRGQTVDGHDFVPAVLAAGAAAVVCERDVGAPVQILVPDATRALAQLAANRFGRPGDTMTLVGITGTNGKTTITYLVESILRAHGAVPGVIGTVEYRSPSGSVPAPFTTPTPTILQSTLARMRDEHCTHVVMECSSHALSTHRLDALTFAVAAFTNLTQDHLDFHGTMEAYAIAKSRLFSERLHDAGLAVVCIDGPAGEVMAAASHAEVLRVSRLHAADVQVMVAEARPDGTALEISTPHGALGFVSPLVGGFNVENLLVAIGIGIALEVPLDTIGRALGKAAGAPGRLERVPGSPACYVDYAHTPDALERALLALRPTTRGKLWVVFGCGGDRDRGKRPQMGRIAEEGADVVLVTSDNPRTEDPQAIVDQIVAGTTRAPLVEVSRKTAIFRAVTEMASDDVLLVAGKGHEDYQIIGKEKQHFDDREEVARALVSREPDRGAKTRAPT